MKLVLEAIEEKLNALKEEIRQKERIEQCLRWQVENLQAEIKQLKGEPVKDQKGGASECPF